MLNLVGSSILYSTFYAVTATIATLFTKNYPFLTETDIGLCYLSIGGGNMISTVLSGRMLDWQYRVYKKRYENTIGDSEKLKEVRNLRDDDEFPIEKARLNLQFYFVVVYSALVIAYGWVIQSDVSLAAPLVFQFLGKSFSSHFIGLLADFMQLD